MTPADLIHRLRKFAKATVETVTAENGEQLTYEDSVIWLAADTLAANVKALAEAKRLSDRWEEGFKHLEKLCAEWKNRADETASDLHAAESSLAEIRAELEHARKTAGRIFEEHMALIEERNVLADCLNCARMDWEANNGEIIDKGDPHWTVEARRLCASRSLGLLDEEVGR